MLKRLLGAIMVIVVFFSSVAQLVYNLGAIRIDFDNIVDEIRPVHNIGRMPEYKVDSEVNSYFAEANMTSCRTHDIRETDIRRIFRFLSYRKRFLQERHKESYSLCKNR